ncbi:hypothetical protein J2T13_000203 [Paenibacillus sp. DS2015]|uniref:hypothetical protein n=1 Tax=Paenibacillus sp. DS2015 TaxID=3373917 RepID=UPI003D1E436D
MEDEQQFNKIYEDTKRRIHNMSIKYHKRSGVPVDEFTSQLNEELWFAYRDYDEGKNAQLMTWINGCLTRRAIDVIREREGSYRRSVTHSIERSSESEDDEQTFDIISDICIEDIVINRMAGPNQFELIESLVSDPVKVGNTTRLIVEEFPRHDSLRATSDALGICHKTAKRKLLALRRRYDGARFGDIHDIVDNVPNIIAV